MHLQPLAPLKTQESFNRLKIAMVDDDRTFSHFAAMNLEGAFDVFCAADGDELMACPDFGKHDCIILDFQLERESGLQLAERLRAVLPKLPPVIMLTGTGDERRVIKAFRSGFADYLPKRRLNFGHLANRIEEAVERARENERRERKLVEKLERDNVLSVFDELTGCYTRGFVMDRVAKLFARGDKAFALLLVEFETLDIISRSCGLVAAQGARRAFAKKLRESLRNTDLVGCLDEHLFLCVIDTHCASAEILERCEVITDSVSTSVHLLGSSMALSGRIGGVVLPEEGTGFQNCVERLMSRLEEARSGGLPHFLTGMPDPAADDPPERSSALQEAGIADDRRCHMRRRILRAAKIYAHNSSITLDCSVRNISQSGALLRFDSYFRPPMNFDLEITGDGERRPAEPRWQIGNDVGVRFTDV